MAKIWRPTAAEKARIREYARKEVGGKGTRLEAGVRFNVDQPDDRALHTINIARLTLHPDWDDTELWDCVPWSTFCAGVPLTADGRAIVDFYVHTLGYDGQLETNVVVYYAHGAITRIEGTRG